MNRRLILTVLLTVLLVSYNNCSKTMTDRLSSTSINDIDNDLNLDEEAKANVLGIIPGIPGSQPLPKPVFSCYEVQGSEIAVYFNNKGAFAGDLFVDDTRGRLNVCGPSGYSGRGIGVFVARGERDRTKTTRNCKRISSTGSGGIRIAFSNTDNFSGNIKIFVKDRIRNLASPSDPIPPCDPVVELPPQDINLRELANRRGLIFGTALDSPDNIHGITTTSQPKLYELATTHFNSITPLASGKWAAIRPNRNTFNFAENDATIEWAINNGMKVRGHTLAWNLLNPSWLENGNFTPLQLKDLLREHIFAVMQHNKQKYPGVVKYYDVVNEAFTASSSIWDRIGANREYVELAFRWAAEADPTAKLIYNDWGNFEAAIDFARRMKNKGVKIDGVGFQMHLLWDDSYSQMLIDNLPSYMRQLRDLGLEAQITEIDVGLNINNPTQVQLDKQAKMYGDVLSVCLNNSNCTAYITWGITDKYSSVTWVFPNYGSGMIWDSNYNAKPVFNRLFSILNY